MKTFQLAVQRAKQAIGEDKWNALDFAQQSSVIYRELKLMDTERARDQAVERASPAASHHSTQPSSSVQRSSARHGS